MGADRSQTPIQNCILDPPHEPGNGGGVDVEACLPRVRLELAQRPHGVHVGIDIDGPVCRPRPSPPPPPTATRGPANVHS